MAASGHRRMQFSLKGSSIFAILILCSVFLLFAIPTLRSSSKRIPFPSLRDLNADLAKRVPSSCDHSRGSWVYDLQTTVHRYDHTCKEIFKGWNCIANNKSNSFELLNWRWKPHNCNLNPMDPLRFLENHRDARIGFIGDSLNRNMFVSMFCTLKQRASGQVKKWRPANADRAFTFLDYNFTVAYHRSNLLARYQRLPSAGGGFRIDVDVPERTWAAAPGFYDVLVFNTGHWWWAPQKFSPALFFENGRHIAPHRGFDAALRNMVSYAERRARPRSVRFFRTQSPRHFEGGEWNLGGSCRRHRAPLTAGDAEAFFRNGTNADEARRVNRHLYGALRGSGFRVLDVTAMSEPRADAHPSAAGGKKHEDCMHWCLPGITDTWNDLFVALLNQAR